MISKSTYKIDLNLEIVFQSYSGQIKIHDIKELVKKIISEPGFSKEFDQVVDFRFCNLIIDIDELPDLVNFFNNDVRIGAVRKVIFLTNNPNEVVLTTLFSQRIKSYKVEPNTVTTIEKSIMILLKPNLDIIKLENILNDLRTLELNN